MIFLTNNLIYILISTSILISVGAIIFGIIIQKRINKIFKKSQIDSLEDFISENINTISDLVKFKKEAVDYMHLLDRRVAKKINAVKTTRYNPFQGEGVGGNQSFVSVFADESGSGVVVTSMHTRERTNVFAKPLSKWQSEYDLGEEEKETIEKAKINE